MGTRLISDEGYRDHMGTNPDDDLPERGTRDLWLEEMKLLRKLTTDNLRADAEEVFNLVAALGDDGDDETIDKEELAAAHGGEGGL